MVTVDQTIPTVYFQHMNTRMLLEPKMVEGLLKIDVQSLENMAHNYAMMSPTKNRDDVGMVHNLDVYEGDIERVSDEIKQLYPAEYIEAISSSEEDIEASFMALMDALFNKHWKTNTIRVMLFKDKNIVQDSFSDIIYSIMQQHYNIKSQILITSKSQEQRPVDEFAYIIEQKES